MQAGVSFAKMTKRIPINKNVKNRKELDQQTKFSRLDTNSNSHNDGIENAIADIRNNIARIEKIVENNSTRIDTIASLLKKILCSNG